jgi:hypothetical protein
MSNFQYFGIILVLFLIIFFINKGKFTFSDIIASLFIFFLGLPLLHKIFIHKLIFLSYGSILSIESYFLLYSIFIYFYVLSVIDQKFKLKKIYLLHFIPFILFSLWQLNYPIPKSFPPPQRIIAIDSVSGKITERLVFRRITGSAT